MTTRHSCLYHVSWSVTWRCLELPLLKAVPLHGLKDYLYPLHASSFLATLMGMGLSHTTNDLTDDIRISVSHLDHLISLLVLLMLSNNTQVFGLAVPGAKLAQAHIPYAHLGRGRLSLMSGCMQVG